MNNNARVLTVLAALALAGCATSPMRDSGKEDAAAAARSQAYMTSLELVPESTKLIDSKPCVVPSAAEKPAPGQTAGPSKDWKSLVAHANTCVKEKNWSTLEILANAIARMDIDSPWGAYFMSVSAQGRGDLQRALWMADLAQKKAGGRAGLYSYQKGRIYFEMKEMSRAMREIESAIALDSRLYEGHLFLAQIHHRDLELDQAASSYAKVIEANPKHFAALSGLAEVKITQGSLDEAADLYRQAIAAQPDHLRAWVRLAYVFETLQKNNPQALNTYKGLKSSIDSGAVRERPDFDLNAKIKTLQEAVQPRVPAQAQAAPLANTAKTVK